MSDIIQLLPDNVANQIAAGEVVQRPASAIKELIENAIDAGATKIKLIVKDAGKTLIQVIDDGVGMSMTDARLCFERHATSKIKKAEDLFAIRTMGFRGEAMASIAAISHVELKTKRAESELGTLVEIEGSKIIDQRPEALPTGTNISVKNLFYNIPARRNFLKSNSVEMRHIIEEFQRITLAHPEIFFSLHSDGNELYHLPAETLKQRIVHIFGNTYNQRLVPVEEDTTIIKIDGFVGKPAYAKKTRGEQFFFVNKRFIRDPYLHHAVMNAYEEIIASETFPLYVLFIEIDPSKIDINVHPTKTEIKYEDEKAIYAIIRSAVKRSLGRYNITPSLDFNQETGFSHLITQKPLDEIQIPTISFNPDFNPFESDLNKPARESARTDNYAAGFEKKAAIPQNWDSLYQIAQQQESFQLPLIEEEEEDAPYQVIVPKRTDSQQTEKQFFQLHNRFIVSQIHSGFILIDQQAAHERILFEQFYAQLTEQQGASQQSLFPQTLDLNPSDNEIMQEILPEICTLGFQIREFGKNSYVIDGIPADLNTGLDEIRIIEQLIEDFKNYKSEIKLTKRENLAKSLAKSAAIKPGVLLDNNAMAELIDKLFACQSPNISIYGKPVIITFTLNELLAKFGKN
ncbi:DNA mismatch repair endonuclease MutL [Sphingobacteriaceae bacterium WQ 2009]|uniref:DNA mismatch repair protein MutL n=1 Tax=Rhinopithecimicrobium faecis TaxID=2820698 RepID=A0A8T4H6I1_9SPHI|nr:DNA mismatch repair endonuclease MutL [Sphingobacteriaceae bacterium WQ 2009]